MRGQIQQGLKGIGFDVYTTGDSDPSLTGDSSYAVLKRPGTDNGAYLLY